MEVDLYTLLYLAPLIFGVAYIINILWGDK